MSGKECAHDTDAVTRVIDLRRLWTGGLATAGVAALTAVVGIFIVHGIFSVSVLAPERNGVWGDVSTTAYALGAAGIAVIATVLMHLLVLYAPRPTLFFGWIMALATAAGVVAPFAHGSVSSAVWVTAALNLALGLGVWVLLTEVAANAFRTRMPTRDGHEGFLPPSPAPHLR